MDKLESLRKYFLSKTNIPVSLRCDKGAGIYTVSDIKVLKGKYCFYFKYFRKTTGYVYDTDLSLSGNVIITLLITKDIVRICENYFNIPCEDISFNGIPQWWKTNRISVDDTQEPVGFYLNDIDSIITASGTVSF